MKTSFSETFIPRKQFVPTAEFATHDLYAVDYNARKLAFVPTEIGDDDENASFKITVVRISEYRKASTGKFTYRYVSGIPADKFADVRMLGLDTRANTIITSASEYGVLNKEVVVDAFLSKNTFEESDNFGKLEVRFARKAKDIARVNALVENNREILEQARVLGLSKAQLQTASLTFFAQRLAGKVVAETPDVVTAP